MKKFITLNFEIILILFLAFTNITFDVKAECHKANELKEITCTLTLEKDGSATENEGITCQTIEGDVIVKAKIYLNEGETTEEKAVTSNENTKYKDWDEGVSANSEAEAKVVSFSGSGSSCSGVWERKTGEVTATASVSVTAHYDHSGGGSDDASASDTQVY